MGMFNIVVVGLIAGILGSTVAGNSQHSIPPIDVWTQGLTDSLVFLLGSGKGVEYFRGNCFKYGGPEAYNKLTESAKDLSTFVMASYRDGWDKPEDRCFEFTELSNFNKNLLKSYKNCLEPETRDNVDDDGIWFPLIRFMCDVRENFTLEYYYNNYGCLHSELYGNVPRDCVIAAYANNYARINVVELASHLLTSDLRREECQIIDEMRTCLMEPLKYCNDSAPADIANAAFRILDEHTSCDKFLPSSAAPSVAAPVVESATASSVDNQVIP